jgi:hypothetical protein
VSPLGRASLGLSDNGFRGWIVCTSSCFPLADLVIYDLLTIASKLVKVARLLQTLFAFMPARLCGNILA